MIDLWYVTKSYGENRGIFDLNFTVKKGEVFGFLGPNGAGKTTALRHCIGLIKPDKGSITINGYDAFNDAAHLHKQIGYIAGEPAFFTSMRGSQFLDFVADMKGMYEPSRRHRLIEMFELDTSRPIRSMSKGMKQKLAIIAAFMHDPDLYILDEPTSGLDPLMQSTFVSLIKDEARRGKTVFMSSHHFDEIEKTCDRALIIKDGRTVALEHIKALRALQEKVYVITTENSQAIDVLAKQFPVEYRVDNTAHIRITGKPDAFIKALASIHVVALDMKQQTLEDIFMRFYRESGDAPCL